MAQTYTDIQPSDLISNSLSMLLGNFETVMSNSSGTTFPSANLQNGMWCYRADQNKLYLLLDKNTANWHLFFDLSNPIVTTSVLAAALATKQSTIGAGSALHGLTASLLPASKALASDVTGKITAAAVSSTELGALANVTGNVQVQFGNKQNKITISAVGPSGGVDGDIWLQVV